MCTCTIMDLLEIHSYFLSLQGPGGWEDVLTPRKLRGQCHKEGCNGTFAVSWAFPGNKTQTGWLDYDIM